MADDPRYAPMPIVDDAELLRRQLLGDANQQMAEEAADATYARGDMSLAADLDRLREEIRLDMAGSGGELGIPGSYRSRNTAAGNAATAEWREGEGAAMGRGGGSVGGGRAPGSAAGAGAGAGGGAAHDDLDSGLPEDVICPITQEVMENPVVAADGFSYEQGAIEKWFETHARSPCTGLYLDNKILVPNHALRGTITWLQKHR